MSTVNVKKEAQRLIEKLPENITWDNLMHEIYVRQSIESGLVNSEAKKVSDVTQVRAGFVAIMRVLWTHAAIERKKLKTRAPAQALGILQLTPS